MAPKRLLLLLVLWLLGSLPIQAAQREHAVEYLPPKSPQLRDTFVALKNDEFLEAIVSHIEERLRLQSRLTFSLEQCNVPNAYYFPSKRRITFCIELIPEIVDNLSRDRRIRTDEESLGKLFAGSLTFIAFHEMGHALVHTLQLPILGREEDAADQISSYLLLTDEDNDTRQFGIAGALLFFRYWRTPFTIQHLSGEHGLSQQRQVNIACWAYGSDPEAFAWALEAARVTNDRAARCRSEFVQLSNSIKKLLGNRLLVPSAR
jgi:hypothetical protein